MQVKTGQDLPKENLSEGLEEVLGSYKAELGLTDKEAEALEHLQARALPALPCLPCPAPVMPSSAMPPSCPASSHHALPYPALPLPCPHHALPCTVMLCHVHCHTLHPSLPHICLQGNAKAQKLVAIIRSHQFMDRYQAEISARDDRIKESKRLG